MKLILQPNETIIMAGNTKMRHLDQQVQGKLIVTNQRIYFKPLSEEMEKFNLEILFGNILEVIFYGKGFFSAKGLNVLTRDGKSLMFPLKKRDEIGQLINKMY